MQLPTPDDPKSAPVWENYVVAQAAQAALRTIPASAHAVGVQVLGTRVTRVVQAPQGATTHEDIDDVVGELEVLLGHDVQVASRLDAADACRLSPHDGVRWFFASRAD